MKVSQPIANEDDVRRDYEARLSSSKVEPEFEPTDHILKRWAASIGDGSPDYDEVVLASKVTPLPDCVAEVVDKLVLRSPYCTLTGLWYRTPVSVEVIARKLRIHEDVVRPSWRASLKHYRVFFETSPLSDLRKLAKMDIRLRREFLAKMLDARAGE